MKDFLAYVFAFGFPLLWIGAIPQNENNYKAGNMTKIRVLKTQKAIDTYQKKYGKLPTDLGQIRFLARPAWDFYIPYDGYGSRLQYLRLSSTDYVVKSFGRDRTENSTVSEVDPTHISAKPLPDSAPQFEPSQNLLNLYPPILLLAQKAGNNQLIARLIVDKDYNERHLVVQSVKRDQFIMVAPHPKVEEFFWLPSQNAIVYTATDHDRYPDGIYLWDLIRNEHHNLLDDLDEKIGVTDSGGGRNKRYFLALSNLDENGKGVYTFILNREQKGLDPETFFSSQNLYFLSFPTEDTPVQAFEYKKYQNYVFEQNISLSDLVKIPYQGYEAQHKWALLPTSGNLEYVIAKWQEFSEQNADSAILPYSLFWLSSIYGDASKLLMQRNTAEAKSLGAFGAELAKALASNELAPSYLRAIGYGIFERLSNDELLGYQVSRLNLP
ncbi:MAG: hypothetical protein AB7T49_08345 [Oligoflexales bacterium]